MSPISWTPAHFYTQKLYLILLPDVYLHHRFWHTVFDHLSIFDFSDNFSSLFSSFPSGTDDVKIWVERCRNRYCLLQVQKQTTLLDLWWHGSWTWMHEASSPSHHFICLISTVSNVPVYGEECTKATKLVSHVYGYAVSPTDLWRSYVTEKSVSLFRDVS